MRKYKTVDLFAGAGGLSYGFMQTGRFDIVAAAEVNKNAQATYIENIAKTVPNFTMIDNVIGYDFEKLSEKYGGIDIVIGGPPCQGFSNANRQKNHLISMNNGLVKEYFRAIREIKPKAFVMENVSMLRSETHRFYESKKDNHIIDDLIQSGHPLPKRDDSLIIADAPFECFEYTNMDTADLEKVTLPLDLSHLLSVLYKNRSNSRRLPKFIEKHSKAILQKTDNYLESLENIDFGQAVLCRYLQNIRAAVETGNIEGCSADLSETVRLQKMITTINEIKSNQLIGKYRISEDGMLYFDVKSYSVIDYIKAILGDEYVQISGTLNSEWFGVPQERRRYIVMGVRKDLYTESTLKFPLEPEHMKVVTVGDAIRDLKGYKVSYTPKEELTLYDTDEVLSEYATEMRSGSLGVINHITTKTTDVAMKRFKVIEQGKNFHSLDPELKGTYSKPERTQTTIYLRLDPNKPSGTVVNVRKSMWIHPTLDRAITVREAARLQSFPDCFVFKGPKDSQYQQVGNAVPPLLAKGIALTVVNNLENI